MVGDALKTVTAGQKIDITLEGLKDVLDNTKIPHLDWAYEKGKEIRDSVKETVNNTLNKIKGGGGGGHGF